ncbi:MAG: magnesium transporter, partial [Nitrosomonadales bacterium]|nr:magnesium transporter [Nitrosomonadales bacterium]
MKNNIERKESLNELIEQINALLEGAGFVENSFNSQPDENHTLIKNLVSKKNISSLERLLDDLHPADIADILESLPVQKRLVLWDLVKSKSEGDILIEVSDAVRQTLIADMDSTELLAAAEQLETDEIADIAPDLPEEVLQDLLENLDIQNR